jgi:hypothetical protein
MNKYNSKQADFQIPPGDIAIIGFQQVLSDPNKVFVWVRGTIDRPNFQDRHKTAKLVNQTFQRVEWAKSVWLIESVITHFQTQLERVGVTEQVLRDLSDDEKSDKWVTINDGERNFAKAILINPASEETGEELNIQITQHLGKTPESIYNRAYAESGNSPEVFKNLLTKYRSKAIIRTYAPSYVKHNGLIQPIKELTEVVGRQKGKPVPVYETNEIVLGEPAHLFVNYEIPNLLPDDNLDEVQAAMDAFMLLKSEQDEYQQAQIEGFEKQAIKKEFKDMIE